MTLALIVIVVWFVYVCYKHKLNAPRRSKQGMLSKLNETGRQANLYRKHRK